MKVVKFVDLFAGIGGFKLGLMQGFKEIGFDTECVMTSEIKKHAIEILKLNFPNENHVGDITQVNENNIPDFDILIGGFPCQTFSVAGRRAGFNDTRGTMFFEIERIIKAKKPFGFILENVDGLVRHDAENKKDKIGRTFKIILEKLNELGYYVSWKVLDAKDFNVPQQRKRIFIVGTLTNKVDLTDYKPTIKPLEAILDHNLPTLKTKFAKHLIKRYGLSNLVGKNIKDKRNGPDNIHSWHAEVFGPLTQKQKDLCDLIVYHRRRKEYGEELGIEPMEGMPLNINQIRRFYDDPDLENMLEDLNKKGYLMKQKPKDMIKEKGEYGVHKYRQTKEDAEYGYALIAGNFNFEITRILHPKKYAPTLTTIGTHTVVVPDGNGLRPLTLREGLRLFGFPEDFKFTENLNKGYDLLGNTIAVPVVKYVATKLALEYQKFCNGETKISPAPKIDFWNTENQLSLFQ